MKRLIVIGLMLILSGCATAKVVDKPTDEIITEDTGNVKQGKIKDQSYGDIHWTYIGQVKGGKYHVLTYKMEITSDLRNKIHILAPGIDDFPQGKWLEVKIHLRCDRFFRFDTIMIKDINEKILHRQSNDEWKRWQYSSTIDNLCKDIGICGW